MSEPEQKAADEAGHKTQQEKEAGQTSRYEWRRVTTDVVLSDRLGPGVLAKIFDRQSQEELNVFLSEDQLQKSRPHNKGKAAADIDAALEAIEKQRKHHGQTLLDGPLSLLNRGPGH